MPLHSLRSRLVLVSVATLLGLLAVEVAFRIAGYGDPLASDDLVMTWVPGSPFRLDPDPDLRVSLSPGFEGAMVYRRAADGVALFDVPVRTSSLGLRGPEIQPRVAPGTLRILALGDSITFGYGVGEEQAFPAVLARHLAPGQPVEVINAGIPTWNLKQEVTWLEQRGMELAPDLVVQLYYLNDLDPPWYDPGPTPVPADLPLRAPPWARREGGLRRVSFVLNQAVRVLERRRLAQDLAASGRMRPGAPDFLSAVRGNWDPARAGGLFQRLRQACEGRGATAVVALLPVFEPLTEGATAVQLDEVAASARAAGLEVLRLDDSVQGLPFLERAVAPGDPHPSAEAHRRLGEALARRLSPLMARATSNQ